MINELINWIYSTAVKIVSLPYQLLTELLCLHKQTNTLFLINVHLPCFQAVFGFEAGGGGKTSR